MQRKWMSLIALLVAGLANAAGAQQDSAATGLKIPSAALSEAEQKFDRFVRDFEKRLTEAGAFSAAVTSRWESSGSGKPTSGTNLYTIAVQAGGKLRIEAGSQEAGERQFVCVSDGGRITRLLRSANLYSQSGAGETLNDLQHDAFTLQTLAGSGVEFLVRPQFRAQLIAQITSINDLGTEQIDGQNVVHFRLAMVDQRTFDLWFSDTAQPVLVAMTATTELQVDHTRTFHLTTRSTFNWKIGGTFPAGTFTLELPEGARRVSDLLSELQDGGIDQLLGRPYPPLELARLGGGKVNLASRGPKQVMVLIFWASWNVSSTDGMATLNEFVELCQQQGAAIYAINLGEDEARVRETVKETGYRGTVLLDRQTESLQAYKIGGIPVTVLVGQDGTVQSFHTGSTPATRARIREDVAALLSGKSLVASPPK